MNKTELIEAIAGESGLKKKDAEAALTAFVNAVEGALAKGEKVQLVGFGTRPRPEVQERAETPRPAKPSRSQLPSTLHSPQARLSRIL